MNDTLQIILQIVLQIIPMVPLVIALVKYVKEAVKEKNWKNLVKLMYELIAEAESKFQSGAEKEDYVLGLILKAAEEINFEIDEEQIRNLISDIISLTKKVNVAVIVVGTQEEADKLIQAGKAAYL